MEWLIVFKFVYFISYYSLRASCHESILLNIFAGISEILFILLSSNTEHLYLFRGQGAVYHWYTLVTFKTLNTLAVYWSDHSVPAQSGPKGLHNYIKVSC